MVTVSSDEALIKEFDFDIPTVLLTAQDVKIHTYCHKTKQNIWPTAFSLQNLHRRGILDFCSSHKCNHICEKLGLVEVEMRELLDPDMYESADEGEF